LFQDQVLLGKITFSKNLGLLVSELLFRVFTLSLQNVNENRGLLPNGDNSLHLNGLCSSRPN